MYKITFFVKQVINFANECRKVRHSTVTSQFLRNLKGLICHSPPFSSNLPCGFKNGVIATQ